MIRISDRSMNEAVSWEDLRDVAGSVFDIWCDGSEQQWAEQAWKYISKAGLAAYQDELGHTQVLIRFLGLAGIYHDFWHVAWEEPSEWARRICGSRKDAGPTDLKVRNSANNGLRKSNIKATLL